MAEGINISLPEVENISKEISTINQRLTSTLEDIQSKMDSLNSTWQSEAASTLSTKVKGLTPRIEEYQKVINAYSLFLQETVKIYGEAETQINNNAQTFK